MVRAALVFGMLLYPSLENPPRSFTEAEDFSPEINNDFVYAESKPYLTMQDDDEVLVRIYGLYNKKTGKWVRDRFKFDIIEVLPRPVRSDMLGVPEVYVDNIKVIQSIHRDGLKERIPVARLK